jgi:hypothetical protein
MMFLIPSFLLVGVNISFFAGIYPTSVGSTKQFGPVAKSLVGLSGIFTGAGGLTGGGILMLFGTRVNKFGNSKLLLAY